MTVGDLMISVLSLGPAAAVMAAVFPLAVGLLALLLRNRRQLAASQLVANSGIAVGLLTLFVVILWTTYAAQVSGMIASTNIMVFIAPVYMVALSYVIEHALHPGRQQEIRRRIRSALLYVILLGVFGFILSQFRFHMVFLSGMGGFLLFALALVGILYILVRKLV